MELVSPAGNIEKLLYAYRYGADAAYIGLPGFSLRARADNFSGDDYREVARIKRETGKRLYCALNVYFHPPDLERLKASLDEIALYPFDAFIISDLGVLPLLKERFPEAHIHLSTQANCTNQEAARLYHRMGISRIVTARELSLDEIRRIKDAVPELEIEAFVHGAMCLAYSGRCFLSAWMADRRSGNRGDCAHSCRWEYRVLEERLRPGEYYPVIEGEGFSMILSSKDLCMFDHLAEMKEAGIDALKIEGRMKSVYYTAVVTRAYRKALDALEGTPVPDLPLYREDLFHVSHREYSTGFYFDREQISHPASEEVRPQHVFLGIIGEKVGEGVFSLDVRNRIMRGMSLEYIGPHVHALKDTDFRLLDEEGREVDSLSHNQRGFLKTTLPVEEGSLVRAM